MYRDKLAPGEHYHIFNRGNNKQKIFLDQRDWIRFLFVILYFQLPMSFCNIVRQISYYVKHRVFNNKDIEAETINKKYVDLVSFTLMPNHFHLILKEVVEGGISKYMQRILNSYTKYFNTRHEKIGHLFQGPYKMVHVKNNDQLLYLSTYIHRNPREIREWITKEDQYPWSSYQDYVGNSRWGNLLNTSIISSQFKDKEEYRDFVKTSPAKSVLDSYMMIDEEV